MKLAVLEPGCG